MSYFLVKTDSKEDKKYLTEKIKGTVEKAVF